MKARLASPLTAAVLLGVWQLAAASSETRFLLGDPLTVLRTLCARTADGTLPYHAAVTGGEAAAGLAIGIVIGSLTGFVCWASPVTARVAAPYVFAVATLPVFAFAPLVIIWFGIGPWMKVALAAFASGVVALSHAFEGARRIRHEHTKLLRMLSASPLQAFRFVVLPGSLASVFHGMHASVGLGLLGAVVGELISADRGLGHFMLRAGALYDVPAVLAGAAYLLAVASLLRGSVRLLERHEAALVGRLCVTPRVRVLARHAATPHPNGSAAGTVSRKDRVSQRAAVPSSGT